eukprot:RCo045057
MVFPGWAPKKASHHTALYLMLQSKGSQQKVLNKRSGDGAGCHRIPHSFEAVPEEAAAGGGLLDCFVGEELVVGPEEEAPGITPATPDEAPGGTAARAEACAGKDSSGS